MSLRDAKSATPEAIQKLAEDNICMALRIKKLEEALSVVQKDREDAWSTYWYAFLSSDDILVAPNKRHFYRAYDMGRAGASAAIELCRAVKIDSVHVGAAATVTFTGGLNVPENEVHLYYKEKLVQVISGSGDIAPSA